MSPRRDGDIAITFTSPVHVHIDASTGSPTPDDDATGTIAFGRVGDNFSGEKSLHSAKGTLSVMDMRDWDAEVCSLCCDLMNYYHHVVRAGLSRGNK